LAGNYNDARELTCAIMLGIIKQKLRLTTIITYLAYSYSKRKTTDEILEINFLKNMDLTADEYLYGTRRRSI